MAQNSVTQPFDMLGFANALLRGVVQSERDIERGQRERRLLREQREAEQRQQREAANPACSEVK